MPSGIGYTDGMMNLQSTISAGTAGTMHDLGEGLNPGWTQCHHPITCNSVLRYEEDGTFSCEHASTKPDEPRTQECLNASIAFLIMSLVPDL